MMQQLNMNQARKAHISAYHCISRPRPFNRLLQGLAIRMLVNFLLQAPRAQLRLFDLHI